MCLACFTVDVTFHAVFPSGPGCSASWPVWTVLAGAGFLRPCIWQSLVGCWSCLRSTFAGFSGRWLQFLCLVRQRIHVHVSPRRLWGNSHIIYVKMEMTSGKCSVFSALLVLRHERCLGTSVQKTAAFAVAVLTLGSMSLLCRSSVGFAEAFSEVGEEGE